MSGLLVELERLWDRLMEDGGKPEALMLDPDSLKAIYNSMDFHPARRTWREIPIEIVVLRDPEEPYRLSEGAVPRPPKTVVSVRYRKRLNGRVDYLDAPSCCPEWTE